MATKSPKTANSGDDAMSNGIATTQSNALLTGRDTLLFPLLAPAVRAWALSDVASFDACTQI
jgi:hypothetical protein